jgi:predicted Zn-dependent protease with MMP-like domain
MDRESFEALVQTVLDDLPPEFSARLENVEVVVEDEPTPGLVRSLGMNPRRHTLFGLYEGVPLSERGATHANALPDKISIFYRPIVREARRPERIREQVRITLLHEIAHFFGMDEDAIDDLGY